MRSENKKLSARNMTLIGVCVAVMAALSQVIIPFPLVPFSFGIFAAMLVSAVLPPFAAILTQAVYLLLGTFGAPVFSQFQGGPQKLLGPTGGFLFGYILLATIVSLMLSFKKQPKFAYMVLVLALGGAACHICGILWLAFVGGMGFFTALAVDAVYFLPDLLKAVLAAAVALRLRKALERKS